MTDGKGSHLNKKLSLQSMAAGKRAHAEGMHRGLSVVSGRPHMPRAMARHTDTEIQLQVNLRPQWSCLPSRFRVLLLGTSRSPFSAGTIPGAEPQGQLSCPPHRTPPPGREHPEGRTERRALRMWPEHRAGSVPRQCSPRSRGEAGSCEPGLQLVRLTAATLSAQHAWRCAIHLSTQHACRCAIHMRTQHSWRCAIHTSTQHAWRCAVHMSEHRWRCALHTS